MRPKSQALGGNARRSCDKNGRELRSLTTEYYDAFAVDAFEDVAPAAHFVRCELQKLNRDAWAAVEGLIGND
jgi:hypothetical protein